MFSAGELSGLGRVVRGTFPITILDEMARAAARVIASTHPKFLHPQGRGWLQKVRGMEAALLSASLSSLYHRASKQCKLPWRAQRLSA